MYTVSKGEIYQDVLGVCSNMFTLLSEILSISPNCFLSVSAHAPFLEGKLMIPTPAVLLSPCKGEDRTLLLCTV